MAQIPIAEGLFTWPSTNPQLIGGQCVACGCVEFPVKTSCPKCGADTVKAIGLHRQGKLWSWTIQSFPPKSPPYTGLSAEGGFTPFGVGYVELPEQVCVEAPLTIADPQMLHIGMTMELVIRPHCQDQSGNTVMAFAFAPVGQ